MPGDTPAESVPFDGAHILEVFDLRGAPASDVEAFLDGLGCASTASAPPVVRYCTDLP